MIFEHFLELHVSQPGWKPINSAEIKHGHETFTARSDFEEEYKIFFQFKCFSRQIFLNEIEDLVFPHFFS